MSDDDGREWKNESVVWAPHVVVTYQLPARDGEDGTPLPQVIVCWCQKCDAKWRYECKSGAVRQHIVNFASAHYHADPFSAPPAASSTP